MRKAFLSGCLLFLLSLSLQGNGWSADNAVLAKFGNTVITVSDFNTIVSYMDAERQKAMEKNPALKENFLRQFVQTMVIANLAKEKGFDKNADVKKQLELFSDNFLANEFLKKEVTQKITLSEAEIKSYYDGKKDEFKTPEMVRARHILIASSPDASQENKKKAREKAELTLKRIKDGEDFEKVAAEVSDDPGSKQKGGDLGFFPRGRMVKPFEDAAFSLKPGEVSGIVETQFGFHIIKSEEKKDASIEPFEKVKDRINQKLVQENIKTKVSEFIDKAMKDAKAEIHPELLTNEKK